MAAKHVLIGQAGICLQLAQARAPCQTPPATPPPRPPPAAAPVAPPPPAPPAAPPAGRPPPAALTHHCRAPRRGSCTAGPPVWTARVARLDSILAAGALSHNAKELRVVACRGEGIRVRAGERGRDRLLGAAGSPGGGVGGTAWQASHRALDSPPLPRLSACQSWPSPGWNRHCATVWPGWVAARTLPTSFDFSHSHSDSVQSGAPPAASRYLPSSLNARLTNSCGWGCASGSGRKRE